MQIKTPSGYLYLDDDDPRAVKIRQGYKYSFENGELIVSNQKTNLDLESLQNKLGVGSASNRDLQDALSYLLKKQLERGKI